MKIKCNKIISPTGKNLGDDSPWIKLNNEYVVLAMTFTEQSGIYVYIQTEHYDEPHFTSLIGFEFLNQKIPSSWITVFKETRGRKSMTLLPESWNYGSFFEDIGNEDPKAVELFNQEVEKIYREEGLID